MVDWVQRFARGCGAWVAHASGLAQPAPFLRTPPGSTRSVCGDAAFWSRLLYSVCSLGARRAGTRGRHRGCAVEGTRPGARHQSDPPCRAPSAGHATTGHYTHRAAHRAAAGAAGAVGQPLRAVRARQLPGRGRREQLPAVPRGEVRPGGRRAALLPLCAGPREQRKRSGAVPRAVRGGPVRAGRGGGEVCGLSGGQGERRRRAVAVRSVRV